MEEGALNKGWTGNDPHSVGAPSMDGKGKMRPGARQRAPRAIRAPQAICSRSVVMSHLRRFNPSWPAPRGDGQERAVSKRTGQVPRDSFPHLPELGDAEVGREPEHPVSL